MRFALLLVAAFMLGRWSMQRQLDDYFFAGLQAGQQLDGLVMLH